MHIFSAEACDRGPGKGTVKPVKSVNYCINEEEYEINATKKCEIVGSSIFTVLDLPENMCYSMRVYNKSKTLYNQSVCKL